MQILKHGRLLALSLACTILMCSFLVFSISADTVTQWTDVNGTGWTVSGTSGTGYWQHISPTLDKDNFEVRYTIGGKPSTYNLFIDFGIQNRTSAHLGPYYFIQVFNSTASLVYRPASGGDVTLTSKAVNTAYRNNELLDVRLVVNQRRVQYYYGDLNTPLIDATIGAENGTGFTGGAINLKSKDMTFTYSAFSLTYETAGTSTVYNDISKWTNIGSYDAYMQYLLPDRLPADNFELQYTLSRSAGNRWYFIDFGIQDSKAPYNGPLYSVAMNEFMITLYSRAAGGTQDTVLTQATTPAAYKQADSFTVKLVVNQKDISFYMGDLSTPALTHRLPTAFAGGSINIKSNKTTVAYSDLSLTYDDWKDTKWTSVNGWSVKGTMNAYLEYVSPSVISANNFTVSYEAVSGRDGLSFIDFGIQNLGAYTVGPLYYVRLEKSLAILYYRPASGADVELVRGTMPVNYINSAYRVQLEVVKKSVQLFVNNVRVLQTQLNESYTGGGVNLKSRLTPVVYRNLEIYVNDTVTDNQTHARQMIADIGSVTPASLLYIEAAKEAYNACSPSERQQVTNAAALTEAEEAYSAFRPQLLGATISNDGQAKLRFKTANPAASLPADYTITSYGTVMLPSQYLDSTKPAYKADATLTTGYALCANAAATGALPADGFYFARLSNSENYKGVFISARSYVTYRSANGILYTMYSTNSVEQTSVSDGIASKAVYQIARDMAAAVLNARDAGALNEVAIEYTDAVTAETVADQLGSISNSAIHAFVLRNSAALQAVSQ